MQVKTAVVAGKLVIASFLALVTVLSALAVPSGLAQTGTASDVSMLVGGTADIGAIKHPDGGSSEGGSPGPTGAHLPHLAAPEMKRIMVLRGYFADYTATSRFTQAEVQNIFDDQMDSLWMNTSYGNIGIDAQVSSLIALPDNREDYITGDFFAGGEFTKGLLDAINNAPAGLDWTDLDAIMVLYATTSAADCHRGGEMSVNLPQGPGGPVELTPAAVFMENPCENFNSVWGRWAHEVGHAFQQGGPAHPSNYNSEFELLDHNLPGHTGVFEKQEHVAFPGWLPTYKYLEFDPVSGGGIANIWAMEYDPSGMPNVQAVKATISDSHYYLISVRRKVLGDELHGHNLPFGIPDEGVLIESVSEGAAQWVTVQGKGGNRNVLWKEGDVFSNAEIYINVTKKLNVTGDHYQVLVRYNTEAFQPDASMEPWRSPPGNTWETTDIWIDSPVNAYGTYRWGSWNDLSGNPVPRGNGDPPAVGLVNRVYARVRNIGTTAATDVVIHVEVTDPLGVGIAGASGFVEIATTDSAEFPGLASIAPGDFEDVYVEWTPEVDLSAEEITDGLFHFHSCLRVIIDPVAGETTFGNQDGDEEQENIDLFEAPETGSGGPAYDRVLSLRNDDTANSKFFFIGYDHDLPAGWSVDVNGGDLVVELGPDEVRDIPIHIEPTGGAPLGSALRLEVTASSFKLLTNDLDPADTHYESGALGGVTIEARALRKPEVTATAILTPTGVLVHGVLSVTDFASFYDPANPFRVMIVGADAGRKFDPSTGVLLTVGADGSFGGFLPLPPGGVTDLVCLFSGTELLAAASCGFLSLAPVSATLKLTPETLNLKSQGRWVTARITFDEAVAGSVEIASLLLEGIPADRVQVLGPTTLLVKFSREALEGVLAPGDAVRVCVTGKLADGRTFTACDAIRVIRPGR